MRDSIGVPKNTIGLIVKVREHPKPPAEGGGMYELFHVQLISNIDLHGAVRRYFAQDLRLIS
jgi:hypothetical protein